MATTIRQIRIGPANGTRRSGGSKALQARWLVSCLTLRGGPTGTSGEIARPRAGSGWRLAALAQRLKAQRRGESLDRLARRAAEARAGLLELRCPDRGRSAARARPRAGDADPRSLAARTPRPVANGGRIGAYGLPSSEAISRQRQHAVRRRVVDARQVVLDRKVERADHVVRVDELVARVEAEDARHGGQAEQRAVRPAEIRAEPVAEAQRRDRDLRVARGEALDGVVGLDDVGLQSRVRLVRAEHLLGEEARVVALAAVVVGAGLEHDLASPASPARRRPRGCSSSRSRCCSCATRARRGRGVDDQAGVDHGVDLGRVDDPAQQRVLGADADELGALERAASAPRSRRR